MSIDLGRREITLSNDDLIVTETDAKGVIKFASKDFCKIAGYTKEELIGSPHNLIRHPLMPSSIFKDLWQTLQSGKIWNGIVINHTKNGGYYWVNATIFISKSSDGTVKYISVRIKPTKEDIDKAHKLYQELKSKGL